MRLICYLSLFMLFSCHSQKGLVAVKYKEFSNKSKKEFTYVAYLKKGYKAKILSGGNEWTEKSFKYLDGSLFYISNEEGKPTIYYDEKVIDDIIIKKFTGAFFLSDTITLQGIDRNGKYWKNKYDGEVNIGYMNISKEKKEEFDKIISSIVKKKQAGVSRNKR